jgi:hypothetical protein
VLTKGRLAKLGRWLAAVAAGMLGSGAVAADFDVGGARLTVKGALVAGTTVRNTTRDPELLPAANAQVLGLTGTAVGGRNSDDADLNFDRGDRVSTIIKGVVDAELKQGNYGALVRAKAWYDLELADGDRPWGNNPNAYVPNQPLSDEGFGKRAKFSGVALMDAYAYGTFTVAGRELHVRAGNLLIPWGERVTTLGGLATINPLDVPALRRAGATPDETRIPFPALFARFAATDKLNLEAFYQFRFEPTEIDGCGSFFSGSDYIAEGCNRVMVGAGSDRTSVATGSFIKRAATREPSNGGEGGIGVTYKADALRSEFGLYFAQYHNRVPSVDAIKTRRSGAPFIPGDPDGLNVTYATEYAERVRTYAVNFTTRLPALTLAGELTYRPNQPFPLNAVDLLNGFASNTAPSLLRNDVIATPLGGLYPGFDRRKVTQAQLAVAKPLGKMLGAASLTISGEAALKYVHDLPDVNLRRYGRSDLYGVGQIGGVCAAPATPKQCSNDGFVTRSAWGYRLRAALAYPGVASGVDLYPTLTFGHDVNGWSYDTVFNEDRQFAVLSLRGEFLKRYALELAYWPVWGGPYNNLKDRDLVSLALGVRF